MSSGQLSLPGRHYVFCGLFLFLLLVFFHQLSRAASPKESRNLSLFLAGKQFDLTTSEGLTNLIRSADALIKLSEAQTRQFQSDRVKIKGNQSLENMTRSDLVAYYSELSGTILRKDRRGLKELRKLASEALENRGASERKQIIDDLLEVAAALNNNHRQPAPEHLDAFDLPVWYWHYSHNAIARGHTVAANLEQDSLGVGDLSKVQPEPSSFWTPPASIKDQDLYYGFGRSELPELENHLLFYDGPKTSYGGCPGFNAICGSLKIKVKFAETTSEPFAARIFAALGYHVEPTDHASHLNLKYDRRLFREFHLRKPVQIQFRLLGIPLYVMQLQQHYDPFDYIFCAVMKDGARISGKDLKRALLFDAGRKHPEDQPQNFRGDIEQRIDYLITRAANIQTRNDMPRSIGPWDFGNLGHRNLRELRAAGLVGAWIGWCDSRFENTRLKIVETNGQKSLKHFFTDLGGGLGAAVGPMSRRCEAPNLFGWSFTKPPKFQGKSKMTIPFRIVDFQPIEDTPAFKEMTVDDARWMARLIAQLTERQILQTLIASGFDSAEVKLYAEKLIGRRDQMISDLGLANEIALLRPQGPDRALCYDPSTDGPVSVDVSMAARVSAKAGDLLVLNGTIVPLKLKTALSARPRAKGSVPQNSILRRSPQLDPLLLHSSLLRKSAGLYCSKVVATRSIEKYSFLRD